MYFILNTYGYTTAYPKRYNYGSFLFYLLFGVDLKFVDVRGVLTCVWELVAASVRRRFVLENRAMADKIEHILSQLLVPDNAIIQQVCLPLLL